MTGRAPLYASMHELKEALGHEPRSTQELEAKLSLLDVLVARTARQSPRMPLYQFLAMLGCALVLGLGVSVALAGSIR